MRFRRKRQLLLLTLSLAGASLLGAYAAVLTGGGQSTATDGDSSEELYSLNATDAERSDSSEELYSLNATDAERSDSSEELYSLNATDAGLNDSSGKTLQLERLLATQFNNCRLEPIAYQLLLVPMLFVTNRSFCGSVSIDLVARENCSQFGLHAGNQLTVGSVSVTSDEEENVTVVSQEKVEDLSLVKVVLSQPLTAGQRYTVSVDRFSASLNKTKMQGLFVAASLDGTKWQLSSQMQPDYARKAFPCFDEPQFKATFNVGVVRRSDYRAAANMPSASNTTVDIRRWFPDADASNHSFVLEQFLTTPPMPTYLVALHLSQFDFVSAVDSAGRLHRVWAPAQWVNCCTSYALATSVKVTEFLERQFGVEYSLNKTDHVPVVDTQKLFPCAMENWGLVAYRAQRLLYNRSEDSAEWHYLSAIIISHEMTHSWFGNLVTPASWANVWLSEGLTTHLANLCLRHLHPDWQADAQFVARHQLLAFDHDEYLSSRAANAEDTSEAKFTPISYSKMGSVMRQLMFSIGAGTYRLALGDYLRDNAFGTVRPSQLYAALQLRAGRLLEVEPMMQTWTEQPGFPLLNCSRQGRRLLLSQSRFLVKSPSDSNATWVLPVSLVTSANASSWSEARVPQLITWMADAEQQFELLLDGQPEVKWYLLNPMSVGHYRVNYDSANWLALSQQLAENHEALAPQDRTKLIDDSLALAEAGRLDFGVPLRLVGYLGNETNPAPWQAALPRLRSLRRLLLKDPSGREKFDEFVRRLLLPAYSGVGHVGKSGEPPTRRLLRSLVVAAACQYALPECRRQLLAEFRRLFANGIDGEGDHSARRPVSPDVRAAVLCEGVRAGAGAEFNWTLGLRRHSLAAAHDVEEAVACSRSQEQLYKLLVSVNIGNALPELNRRRVTRSVSATSRGMQAMLLLWQRMQENIQPLAYYMAGNAWPNFRYPEAAEDLERWSWHEYMSKTLMRRILQLLGKETPHLFSVKHQLTLWLAQQQVNENATAV